MIAQIPHESQVQKFTLFVPKSQIHWVLWKVWIWRGRPSVANLELEFFLASQLIDSSLESGGTKTALVSFTGFGHATWEANLVDLSDLDRFGTIPLMLEVGDD